MSMAIADLIGRPYSGEGRTFDEKAREVDCYELVREGVKRLCNVELPATPAAALVWKPEGVSVTQIDLTAARPGDVVEMHMLDTGGKPIVHVGLVVDGGAGGAGSLRVLHARRKHRSCLTSVAALEGHVARVVRYERK